MSKTFRRVSRSASIASRLARLERLLAPPEPEVPDDEQIADEEWLSHFRLYHQKGYFRNEPDFPQALHEYEQAMERARESGTWLPPSTFMPHETEIRRRRFWRIHGKHREVQQALAWLIGMYCRVSDGIPAVTLSEWEFLTGWFHRHSESDLRQMLEEVAPRQSLDSLRTELKDRDGRSHDAATYAAILRQLYAEAHRMGNVHESIPAQVTSAITTTPDRFAEPSESISIDKR
ncbi:MAG: hypothetical protein JNJ77_05140 [Planctomycetia bacterium]|nr:hypothetical protein [Planctomycetia bacterium]